MIIRRLTSKDVLLPKAIAVTGKNKDVLHYNLKHGTYGKGLFVWWCGLSTRFYKPTSLTDCIELNDDDYNIIPIKKNNKVMKTPNGDVCYFITKDDMVYHKTDILLLWEIPNKNYTDVNYIIEGNVKLIGSGSTGKRRDDTLYKSPAPVLEITGNCTLKWTAKDIDNNIYTQIIEYDSSVDSWDIQPIKKEKGDKDEK